MSRDTSFYYSFLVLPPRKRKAVIAVWDVCRAVDDAVDEAVPEQEEKNGPSVQARERASEQIAAWRTEIAACYEGEPRTWQGRALQPFIREFNLPRSRFEELIEGVEMDLSHVRYSSFEALIDYCRRVASAVGLICVEIFGYRDPAARAYATDLGIALQLTNIIRDVASDLRRGRVYLPLEDMTRFGVREDALRAGVVTDEIRALLRHQCERARRYYFRAAEELPATDARNLIAAEIMAAIYFGILRKIERADYDVFSRRQRLPRPHRALIALGVLARGRAGPVRPT